jgi:hypothetical protein
MEPTGTGETLGGTLGGSKKCQLLVSVMVANLSRAGAFGADYVVLGTRDYRRERVATFLVGARNACDLALFFLAHGN